MNIRKANENDVEDMLRIFSYARKFMAANGNPNQWEETYPSRELLLEDISSGDSYIITDDDGKIHGTFLYRIGDDPTYHIIEDGKWLNEEMYGVIHRIAQDGQLSGMLEYVINFCLDRCKNIRIDTHHDNSVMLHLLEKFGFSRCGIIYCRDGSPRIALHKKGVALYD